MPPKKTQTTPPASPQPPISLKELARKLDLSPATVSVVLNDVPGRSISEATRKRVREAAAKYHYRPSLLARSLRRQRTMTIGVLLPEVGDGYHAQVLGGIADELERLGYSYLIAQHRHQPERVNDYTAMLLARGAEGILAVDTHFTAVPHVPVVAVAGHERMDHITNVILDHDRAAQMTIEHLHQLGHREIALMRGMAMSSDTEVRWRANLAAAKAAGIRVQKEMMLHLTEDSASPEPAYPLVRNLLKDGHKCTAIVCFNDVAAIGAIRAVRDAKLRVPEDISIVGFDDIRMAAFFVPSITTVRQPLQQMGETAARVLVERIADPKKHSAQIAIEPQFINRESTGPVRR